MAGYERPVPEDSDQEDLDSWGPSESDVVAKQFDDQYVQAVVNAAAAGQPPAQTPRADVADAPDVFAEYAGRLVDLKGVGRFPAFSGEEPEWPDWRFRFENCAELIDLGGGMRYAEKVTCEIDIDRLLPKYVQRTKLLYGILVQVCSGRALSLLCLVGKRNGLEGRRILVNGYEPATSSRSTAMLSALLTPEWGWRPFLDELLEWERAVESYEAASGERFLGSTKCAVVSRWAPDQVRECLRVNAEDPTQDWQRLRAAIRGYYSRGVIYSGDGMTTDGRRQPAKISALTPVQTSGPVGSGARADISRPKKPWRQRKRPGQGQGQGQGQM